MRYASVVDAVREPRVSAPPSAYNRRSLKTAMMKSNDDVTVEIRSSEEFLRSFFSFLSEGFRLVDVLTSVFEVPPRTLLVVTSIDVLWAHIMIFWCV